MLRKTCLSSALCSPIPLPADQKSLVLAQAFRKQTTRLACAGRRSRSWRRSRAAEPAPPPGARLRRPRRSRPRCLWSTPRPTAGQRPTRKLVQGVSRAVLGCMCESGSDLGCFWRALTAFNRLVSKKICVVFLISAPQPGLDEAEVSVLSSRLAFQGPVFCKARLTICVMLPPSSKVASLARFREHFDFVCFRAPPELLERRALERPSALRST